MMATSLNSPRLGSPSQNDTCSCQTGSLVGQAERSEGMTSAIIISHSPPSQDPLQSPSQQKLLAIHHRPEDILPRGAAVLGVREKGQELLRFGLGRLAAEGGEVQVLQYF